MKVQEKNPIINLHDFLNYYDEEFIDFSYRQILSRDSDVVGKNYYLARIRSGVGRVEIILDIRYGKEGVSRNKSILGIEKQYKLYKLLKLPIIGRFLRLLGVRLLDENTDRSIRAIENYVFNVKPKFETISSQVYNQTAPINRIQPTYTNTASKDSYGNIATSDVVSQQHNNKADELVINTSFTNSSKEIKHNINFALAKNLGNKEANDLGILEDKTKLIAFYLPQFHRVKENSDWWGPGFTEWTNTVKAKPNFNGHIQPHVPRELGFYDLESPAIMHEQAELAKTYGLHGFCFYYYWFSGRRILEKPLDNFLNAKVDMPFCLCWANENWTRTWDGAENSVLLEQKYAKGDEESFICDILPFLKDDRYIKVNGKPILLIYRIKQLPDPVVSIKKWRNSAKSFGLKGLHIAVVDFYDITSPEEVGADALVEFPPHKFNGPDNRPDVMPNITNPNFAGGILDYDKIIAQSLARPIPSYKLYRGIIPGWDNTPRRQNTPTTIVNNSPELYGNWLKSLRRYNRITAKKKFDQIIFINAWNEWGEGCHLEPDVHSGLRYLEETLKSKWYDGNLE